MRKHINKALITLEKENSLTDVKQEPLNYSHNHSNSNPDQNYCNTPKQYQLKTENISGLQLKSLKSIENPEKIDQESLLLPSSPSLILKSINLVDSDVRRVQAKEDISCFELAKEEEYYENDQNVELYNQHNEPVRKELREEDNVQSDSVENDDRYND